MARLSAPTKRLFVSLAVCGVLAAGMANVTRAAGSSDANPSPTAGGSSSQQANRAADEATQAPVEYANATRKGPALVVLPGEVKSGNASFAQRVLPNNIADFGELELSRANFAVLERSNLGPLLGEFQLAYNLGDIASAGRFLAKGRLKATRWVVKFDVLKAEPVASAEQSFDGGALGTIIGFLGGSKASAAGGTAVKSVKSDESAGVWLVGMRYKILDANTTEQVATGYLEDKMEIGAKTSSVLGFGSSAKGGLTLDTMVQRLVQKSVAEIDAKYK